MTPRYLRFARTLALTVNVAALAGCSAVTHPADAAATDSSPTADALGSDTPAPTDGTTMADGTTTADGSPPECPNPRPPDLTPCTNPGYVCIVPPDPSPPDVMVTPSGGQCQCDASGGMPVWRCFLAGGPLPPPELFA